MVDPARYAPTRARIKGATALRLAMKVAQAAGAGCTMPDPGQPTDWEWQSRIGRASAEQRYKARKIWGFPTDPTPSLMDRDRLQRVFSHFARTLAFSTTLCVIGSAPSIMLGQPGRQTRDIEVFEQDSDYDEVELRRACRDIGIEMYVDNEKHLAARDSYIEVIEPGVSVRIMSRPYLQVVRRGENCAVDLPREFPVERVGEFGRLLVLMPEPALLVALKLVRGDPQDFEDSRWWITERALSADKIQAAIDTLPASAKREAAGKNLARMRMPPP